MSVQRPSPAVRCSLPPIPLVYVLLLCFAAVPVVVAPSVKAFKADAAVRQHPKNRLIEATPTPQPEVAPTAEANKEEIWRDFSAGVQVGDTVRGHSGVWLRDEDWNHKTGDNLSEDEKAAVLGRTGDLLHVQLIEREGKPESYIWAPDGRGSVDRGGEPGTGLWVLTAPSSDEVIEPDSAAFDRLREQTSSPVRTSAAEESSVLAGKIAFTVLNTLYKPEPLYDLFVANADGTDRRLVAPGMRQPDMRADSMILAKGQGHGQDTLYAMDGDGSNKRQISPFGTDERPSWAPAGDSFVFTNREDRGVIAQDSLTRDAVRHPLTYDMHSLFGKHAAWLPDGRVIYNGCNVWGGSGSCGLYIAGRSGELPISLTTEPSDLSPDVHEHKVVFMSHRDGNWEIYRVNVDGSGLQRLTSSPGNDGLPAWSPFGHLIAFLSDRGGEWAVWAMEIDGSKPRKLFDLEGGMGEDWVDDRITWHGWPQDVEAPPTPTPAPVVPEPTLEAAGRSLAFSDTFSDTLSGLPDTPDTQCDGYYEEGQYHLSFTGEECGRNYAIATYDSDYKYFTLEVDVGRLDGEGEHLGSGEIVFGYQDDANYYAAAVSRWGRHFRIYRVKDGVWEDLRPWTEAGVLHDVRGAAEPGPVWDRITLVVRGLPEGGTSIESYSGGRLLGEAVDQYYEGGAIGFGVHAGGNGHVAVDNFEIEPLQ